MDFNKLTDQEIIDIATPLMDNLMEASTERNHKKHVRDFTDRLKAIVTEEELERQWRENTNGEFSNREFLSIIRKKDKIFVLWKQYCTKSDDEFLAEIYIIEKEGKLLVDHAWVR